MNFKFAIVALVLCSCSGVPGSVSPVDAGSQAPEIIFPDAALAKTTEDAVARHSATQESCFQAGASYNETFAVQPPGTCGPIAGGSFIFKKDNSVFAGGVCSTITEKNCSIENADCFVNGSGFVCTYDAHVSMQPDGSSGTGIVKVDCRQIFCNPSGICAYDTILGSGQSCYSMYDITLTKEE